MNIKIIIIFILLSFIICFLIFRKKKLIISKSGKWINRSDQNPLMSPANVVWKTQGTFNPTAISDEKGIVHMLYRAIGDDGISRIGYCASEDGIVFKDELSYPVFTFTTDNQQNNNNSDKLKEYNPSLYFSGGSWSGSEDPRMVLIDDIVYVTFNAFDGWDSVRVGLISIKKEDFVGHKWKWSRPLMISPKRQVHKNWVLFPEKINGKFAVLHSITPKISIDYLDSFNTEDVIYSPRLNGPQPGPKGAWDYKIRSAGPPPVKTSFGWLLIYHAMDKNDPNRYKFGAMLLDLKDPSQIIARAPEPILSPDAWYENDWKPGIIYACGAIVKGDQLFVYYGGGDKHICTAHTKLKPFLEWLIKKGKINSK